MIDTCVCCGTYVPEGHMICPGCEKFGEPKIVVNKKDAILEYLKKYHCGRRNAVHSKEIERTFSLDDRAVRRKISALRKRDIQSAAETWATTMPKLRKRSIPRSTG